MLDALSRTTGPQRLVWAAAAGAVAYLLPWPVGHEGSALFGWTVAAAVHLSLSAWLAARFDVAQIRARARAQDESAAVLFLLMVAAVTASVAAIVLLLQQSRGLPADERALRVALSAAALAASWLWIHSLFAFHYAHRYYQQAGEGGASQPQPRAAEGDGGGLDFPGTADPDYYDFLYFSLVIGMTSQVSDVSCTSRAMRRLAMGHGLLAFVFNVVVLALGINALAGSLQ